MDRQRRGLVTGLIVLATVLGVFAVFSVWANRQALETETWTETSTELLEDEEIRTAVAGFLVEALYSNVDVQAELSQRLPPPLAPLAGPAASGLRELSGRVAYEALGRPRVQALWEEANRRAHERFVQVVEGESELLEEDDGAATLELGTLLTEVSERTGVGGRLVERLPEDTAEIEILRSEQIGLAQDLVRILRGLAILLTVLALGLFALAVFLARGWRREALRSVGIAFVVLGFTVLVARSLAGNAVVDSLASTAAVEPAAESTWEIGTSLLRASAVAMIGYGILIILGAVLAGPSRAATAARRGIAPYLRERPIAYTAAAVIVLLVLWWNPTPGTSRLVPTLVLIGLVIAGLEALRRITEREFPDAERGAIWASVRDWFQARRREPRADAASSEDVRLKRLESLAELHKAGVLDEAELRREKERILSA